MKNKLYALILLLAPITLPATNHLVTVADFEFQPAVLSVSVGDTVTWVWVDGFHTTTSASVPAGAATWDEPITDANPTYSYVVTTPGTYTYACTPHAGMNMLGSIFATATSINEAEQAEMFVRVTPEKQLELSLNLPAASNFELTLLDMLGRQLKSDARSQQPAGKQKLQMNLSSLTPGYYFVRFSSADKVLTRRIYVH